ncbi:DUF3291 domain-containing protein [Streptomyces sp. NPDC012888]|uniref:DUF3291 domain-containing protein n=1 Tax=Streptomyces sp. NPDC012888 TaxID=3364855 RepID=UPI0036AF1E2E
MSALETETATETRTGTGAAAPAGGDGGRLLPLLPTTLAGFADCDETDLTVVVPWTGPAIDPETGLLRGPLPDRYLISASSGWPKPDAEETTADMIQVLIREGRQKYGMLAATFAYSERCWHSAKGLSLWRDEESMRAFVQSADHVVAMRKTMKVMYAWESTHWVATDTARLPTFAEGKARLSEVRRDHPVR